MLAFPAALLHPRHWLSWLGVLPLCVLAYVPWQVRYALARLLGRLIYWQNPKRRHIIQANLQHCFPHLSPSELKAWTVQHLQHYAHALLDYSLLFFRSRAWLLQRIDIVGQQQLADSVASGQRLILLLGHSVWLEFAPVAIGQRYAAYGSYKPFKNPVFNWLITRSRLHDVEFVVAREEGMMRLVRALQPGRLLFFLADQDHGIQHSVFAPFFAPAKATLTTPARMARLAKARARPVLVLFDAHCGRYQVHIGDELPEFGTHTPEQDALLLNQGLQQLIVQDPVQYMWLLKLFRTRPEGVRALY